MAGNRKWNTGRKRAVGRIRSFPVQLDCYSVNETYAHSVLPVREDRQLGHRPIRLLIAGAGSYIGTSVQRYLEDCGGYHIDVLDTRGLQPVPELFRGYDAVFFAAGIAHRRETAGNAHLYYEVNWNLAVKAARAAKAAHVPHFILMSSMSVYGMTAGHITKDTRTAPKSHYGRSKLAADERVWGMRGSCFRIAILRPPMVYGHGCRGNYQLLRKLALALPVFPDTENERSMIYIGNLCSFVKSVVDGQREGIFFPQDAAYVNTGRMAAGIASANGKKLKLTGALNPLVRAVPWNVMDKVFGSLTYEKADASGTFGFAESIRRSEKGEGAGGRLNLWIFHHYATTPERNGYIRPFRFAKHLERHKVSATVFASSYHHWADMDVIKDGAGYRLEISDGVPFVFVKTPSSVAGNAARIRNMAAFAAGIRKTEGKIACQAGKPDVILASSPHPLTLLAGLRTARKYRIPCICEVRDLWPEAVFASGRLKEKGLAGRLLTAGEHWIYKHADALVFTKEGDTDYLLEKRWMTPQGGDISPEKCFYINNGVEMELFDRQAREEILDDADLEEDCFRAVYTGAVRPVNQVENIVEAAGLLPQDSGIKILVYGDGNLRKELEQKVRREKLHNVKIKGYVEQKYIPYILSRASVNLLNYSSTSYNWSRGSSSNKLFEYLASGKPVIATVKTGYSVIEKHGCGLEMDEASPQGLAEKILEVRSMDSARYEQMCAGARKAAYEFDYQKLAEKLWDVICWVRKRKA